MSLRTTDYHCTRTDILHTCRRGLAVAAMGNALYAIGGLDDTACFDTVERYDPSIDNWSPVAPMNIPRGGVGVGVLKVSYNSSYYLRLQ